MKVKRGARSEAAALRRAAHEPLDGDAHIGDADYAIDEIVHDYFITLSPRARAAYLGSRGGEQQDAPIATDCGTKGSRTDGCSADDTRSDPRAEPCGGVHGGDLPRDARGWHDGDDRGAQARERRLAQGEDRLAHPSDAAQRGGKEGHECLRAAPTPAHLPPSRGADEIGSDDGPSTQYQWSQVAEGIYKRRKTAAAANLDGTGNEVVEYASRDALLAALGKPFNPSGSGGRGATAHQSGGDAATSGTPCPLPTRAAAPHRADHGNDNSARCKVIATAGEACAAARGPLARHAPVEVCSGDLPAAKRRCLEAATTDSAFPGREQTPCVGMTPFSTRAALLSSLAARGSLCRQQP